MGLMDVAQLLGNIGEFIGAIGVVVTLVYLAKQIHSGTEATKALVRQGITDFSLRYISLPLDGTKLSTAYTKWRRGESLTDEEAELLTRYQSVNFAGMEGVHYCYSLGIFGRIRVASIRESNQESASDEPIRPAHVGTQCSDKRVREELAVWVCRSCERDLSRHFEQRKPPRSRTTAGRRLVLLAY